MSLLAFISFLTLLTPWITINFGAANEVPARCKGFPGILWPGYTVGLLKNLKNTARPQENILISPLGTYLALSTLHLGAGERTRKELAKVLKLSANNSEISESNVHETLTRIQESLQAQPPNSWGAVSKTVLANGLFVQKDFPIKDSYVNALKKHYNGSASNVDFRQGREATDTINKWISEKTLDRISKFYDEPINPETIATLVSTLYFNGKWKNTFDESTTKLEKFNTGSSEIEVPMMSNTDFVQYFSDPSLQYDKIWLPYVGDDYHMTVVLPHRSQTISNLTDHLHLAHLASFTEATLKKVEYKLPKMKFNWKKSLIDALQVRAIFDNPDLSEVSTMAVKISDMVHATELEVDEEGTKASAVTAIQVMPASAHVSNEIPIKFYVDRPFIIAIGHSPTCVALFTAVVHMPVQ